MIKLSTLFERRDALQNAMNEAVARHDYIELMRLTADHSSVSADIDRVRAALARHIGRELEQLQSGGRDG